MIFLPYFEAVMPNVELFHCLQVYYVSVCWTDHEDSRFQPSGLLLFWCPNFSYRSRYDVSTLLCCIKQEIEKHDTAFMCCLCNKASSHGGAGVVMHPQTAKRPTFSHKMDKIIGFLVRMVGGGSKSPLLGVLHPKSILTMGLCAILSWQWHQHAF